eukprot:1166819_1
MSLSNVSEKPLTEHELKFQQDIEKILLALQTPIKPSRKHTNEIQSCSSTNSNNKLPWPQLECSICHQKFDTAKQFETHSWNIHRTNRCYKCTQCAKCYMTKGTLQVHVRRIHNKETNFECSFCGKAFFGRTECTKHEDSTGQVPISGHERLPKRNRKLRKFTIITAINVNIVITIFRALRNSNHI